jgi:hypothetical protein
MLTQMKYFGIVGHNGHNKDLKWEQEQKHSCKVLCNNLLNYYWELDISAVLLKKTRHNWKTEKYE